MKFFVQNLLCLSVLTAVATFSAIRYTTRETKPVSKSTDPSYGKYFSSNVYKNASRASN